MALASILSGCANNPTQGKQAASRAVAVPVQEAVALPASTAQRLDAMLNIQFDWWKLLRSSQLNALIEQVLKANPTVEEAQSTLLKLQQKGIPREGYFHSAISISDATSGQGRLQFVQDIAVVDEAKFIGDRYYDLHAWQLTVGYVPELLRSHSQASSPKTEAEISRLQLEATYRTLAANLIASAVQDASLRAQMAAARKIVAIEQSLLAIARKRQQGGQVNELELAARKQSVEFATQALQRLKAQFEQIRAGLHLLLNIPSDKELPEIGELDVLKLAALPLELPAALIEQRPDVRAAQLEMLPANTKYQSTANIALKNLENTLLAIHNDAITLKAANASEQENWIALASARKLYAANKVGYQEVLFAEQGTQFAALRLVQARAKHLGNAVVLYHALGGGWWAMDDAVRLEISGELSSKQLIR